MVAFILVPKNRSLKDSAKKALKQLKLKRVKLLEVRGEDIPAWIYRLASLKKNAVGLTGEDLFQEFVLKKENSELVVLKKVAWKDPKALFGKPVLCLLGPKGKKIDQLPKELRIGISSKYKTIASKYLAVLENKGYVLKKLYVNGCCETLASAGIADLIVDIVYTGSSMQKAGLEIYDSIFASDFVIIGSKKFWSEEA